MLNENGSRYYVKLIYFDRHGKFKYSGSYVSDKENLFEIWNEILEAKYSGDPMPGLICSGREFIISVKVPTHPHKHPRLIV